MNWTNPSLKDFCTSILRLSFLGALYVLAAPVYITLGAFHLYRVLEAFTVIASGRISCGYCGHENVLNRLATCNRCKATEYGSLLYCSFCRQVSRFLFCEGCGVTLSVVPGVSK